MKKFKYIAALMATLGVTGGTCVSSDALAQTAKDESLAPIVMVLFDTSGSMDDSFGTGYTRLTKAMAELAGSPKVSSPGLIKGSKIRLPRAYRECKDNKCTIGYKCMLMDRAKNGSNLGGYNVANVPYVTTDEQKCLAHDYYDDYNDDGVLQSYLHTVKFGFVGMGYESYDNLKQYIYGQEVKVNSVGWKYGKNIMGLSDKYKKYKKNYSSGTITVGIYTADPQAHAPTIYPVTSDEDADIVENNKAVLTSIRSYYVGGGTPTGASLADLHHMLNDADPDPGIIAQPIHDYSKTGGTYKNLKELVGTIDHKYHCRDKAVILVADGESGYTSITTAGYFGQNTKIWEDADRLRQIGVKVYPIVYAYTDEPTAGSIMDPAKYGSTKYTSSTSWMGKAMNQVAFYGGTCRDKNGNVLDPLVDSYDDFMKEPNVQDRICYYNANNSDTLRSAFITALSDMLRGTISKTSVATTTAIGQRYNYKDGIWNNGYYNVYSGYRVTLGPVRDTVLQRTAVICDHKTGEFSVQDDQFLDITNRLKCKLRGGDYCVEGAYTGYSTNPAPCTETNTDYASSASAEPANTHLKNTCLQERYLFTANYAKHTENPTDRYAISTFGDDKKLLKNISLMDGNKDIVGVVPKSINSGTDALGTASDANFLARRNTKSERTKCDDERARSITEYYGEPNYLLSPYECVEDFDCGRMPDKQTPRYCDMGRCINPGDFAKKKGCTSNKNKATGEICIGKYWRKQGSECTTHAECGVGEVCHAGTCKPGTVFSCDMRQFMATVPLGTIEYASPVPVAPPTKAYKSFAYRRFSTKYWKRDSLLMVGANDGMLHAFVLGDNLEAEDYKTGTYNTEEGLAGWQSEAILPDYPDIGTDEREGNELWAFVPKTGFKNLYKLTEFHNQYFVNSKPVVADIQLPSGVVIDNDAWRTVLVGGFREGGRGYYAMDITNPAKPYVLWEIDYQWQPWQSPKYPDVYENSQISIDEAIANQTALGAKQGYPFQLMGYSYAEPVITNLLIHDKVEPVAILAGGKGVGNGLYDQIGKAIYIVKLFPKSKEDLLVKTFYFADQVTGSPEVYPNNFNSIAQHIYVGDAKGALYRLDVSDANPENWGSKDATGALVKDTTIQAKKGINDTATASVNYNTERPVFNPEKMNGMNGYKYKEITFKPAVSLLGYMNGINPAIQIVYGTGSNDNFNITNTDRHYVASFVDIPNDQGHYQLNSTNSPCFDPKVVLLNSDLNVFKTSVTDSNYGEQAYGVYSKDPVSGGNLELLQKMTGGAITHNYVSYFPTFVADPGSDDECSDSGHANLWRLNSKKECTQLAKYGETNESVQNIMNDELFQNTSVKELDTGTKVYGLEITNQMYCISDDKTKPNQVLAPQILAQTGVNTSLLASDAGSRQLTSNKVNINAIALNLEAFRPEVSRVTWASVYE